MLAFMTGISALALDETKEEHVKLARAVTRVASHYDIPAIDPVTRDWIMLGKTCALIYGPRLMLAWSQKPTPQKPAAHASTSAQQAARNPVQQAPQPKPAPAPQQNAPQYAEVEIPGFGVQTVRIN